MYGNNVLGLIFSNVHEERAGKLAADRTMGSIPFGGRYRMIDFPLSNMINFGINKVGVITKKDYPSLIDHLGSGKEWNLSRKREGLYILPPFEEESGIRNSRIESLNSIKAFIEKSDEDYVLLTDSDTVCNIDYSDIFSQHVKTGADITLVCAFGKPPKGMSSPLILSTGSDMRVRDMLISQEPERKRYYGIGMMLTQRRLLMQLVADCISRNLYSFKRDLLQRNLAFLKIYAYEFKNFAKTICSTEAYYDASMALLNPNVRAQLFSPCRPIFTKIHDDMPARYGAGSSVSNSLVANNCVIEGQVENSVLFRGVHIGKDTAVKNCVITQGSCIRPGSRLSYAIVDRNTIIKDGRTRFGLYPIPFLPQPDNVPDGETVRGNIGGLAYP